MPTLSAKRSLRSRIRSFDVAYVLVIGTFAAIAMQDPQHPVAWAWAATLVLTLPGFLLCLPVFYGLGALLWAVSGADQGGPTWPVTVGYIALAVGTAVVNVLVLRGTAAAVRRVDHDRRAGVGQRNLPVAEALTWSNHPGPQSDAQ